MVIGLFIAVVSYFSLFATRVSQQLESLIGTQQETKALIDQQNAFLHPKMPPDWESRFTELEKQIKNKEKWPMNVAEAKHFLDSTNELINGIPVWAEVDYRSRLNSVRWAAIAFGCLNPTEDTKSTDDENFDLLEELENVVSSKPDGGSAELERSLEEKVK